MANMLKNFGGIVNYGTINGNTENKVSLIEPQMCRTVKKSPKTDSDTPRSETRRLLQEYIQTDSDLDAFCVDFFPDVYSQFTDTMDRTRKINILLTRADSEAIQKKIRHNQGGIK